MVINRFCEVLYLSFERRPFALLIFFQYVCSDHVRCSYNTRPIYLVCVLGIIFWSFIRKFIFFVICFLFSWKITTYLFYPHSVRSCLLEAIVQLLLNHGSYICFFVLESCLKYKMIHN